MSDLAIDARDAPALALRTRARLRKKSATFPPKKSTFTAPMSSGRRRKVERYRAPNRAKVSSLKRNVADAGRGTPQSNYAIGQTNYLVNINFTFSIELGCEATSAGF
jgi:hypothetical protein